MIYSINKKIDNQLQNVYNNALKELNDFFGINWVRNLPRLIVVNDRKTIDDLFGKQTEGWVIGWSENRNIYILDRSKFSTESDHKQYSDEEYAMLIKHEMSHSFFSIVAKDGDIKPKWLWEGVAVYTSGQNKSYTRPTTFKTFLKYFDEGGKEVYSEAGFAIQLLVEKHGKQKLLSFMSSSKFSTKEEFGAAFKAMFGFEPTYEEFNKLLHE